jgi:two-component system, response regulator PdtaR
VADSEWKTQCVPIPSISALRDTARDNERDNEEVTNRPVALIVEDEPLLLMLAADAAAAAGFVALEACNADEAVSLLESRVDIAVLFTDIEMPGSMSGLKLAHVVHQRWPKIKIMVVSGAVDLQPSALPPGSQFMAKPYRFAGMVTELHVLATSQTHRINRGVNLEVKPAGRPSLWPES